MDKTELSEEKVSEKRHSSRSEVKADGATSDAAPRPMATIQDDDERLLARIGYRQVSQMSTSMQHS